jgi:hypothetical protein
VQDNAKAAELQQRVEAVAAAEGHAMTVACDGSKVTATLTGELSGVRE